MQIIDFFQNIGLSNDCIAASPQEILEKEISLARKIPLDLKSWYKYCNGLTGDYKLGMWRFFSLEKINTIKHYFPDANFKPIDAQVSNYINTSDYLIFCDQHVGAPYYAVNLNDGKSSVIALFPNAENFYYCFVSSDFKSFENLIYKSNPDFDLSIRLM